jgi:glucose-1-phosphate thymidylyltransferase
MKIIVPMAGMGKRMRPHTLTIPKPLIPIAGKPIVQRLVEELAGISPEPVVEIAYIVGRFGEAVERDLIAIANNLGAKGTIHYQDEALGTAHAILCAREALNGKVIVAFADTLFKADIRLDPAADGVLWVKQIDRPEQFGVVELNNEGHIINFVEKPQNFVSDLAMIGIYYFKQGEVLAEELQYLIDEGVVKGGEYQLPDALMNMTKKGMKFVAGTVNEWMDCGNKNATVATNASILRHHAHEVGLVSDRATIENSVIVEPCYIGDGVTLRNSVVGPYASIGHSTLIESSIVRNCIIQEAGVLRNVNLENTMLGKHVELYEAPDELSLSDYATLGK